MRKKYLCIGIIVILITIIVIQSTYIVNLKMRNPVSMISEEEAEEIMQGFLIDVLKIDQWDEEVMLEPPWHGEAGDSDVHCFELRFKESDRLIASYAVTVDGKIIFWYDPADDVWVVQEE